MAGTGGGGRRRAGTGGGAGVTPTVAGQIVDHRADARRERAATTLGEWFEVYNPSTTVTYDLMGCDVGDLNTFLSRSTRR